jgi:two-component system sensor histidine kinase KdpD
MAHPLQRLSLDHIHAPRLSRLLYVLAMIAIATVALAVVIKLTNIRHISIGYVIPVMIAAIRWGVLEAAFAALLAVGASAFFFYAPIYDFRVYDPLQIVDLLLFLLVAVVTGHFATRLRVEAERANRRERELGALYAFSRRLTATKDASDIYDAIQQHLALLVGRKVALFESRANADSSERFERIDVPQKIQDAVLAAGDGAPGGGSRIVADKGGHNWLVRPLSNKTADFGIIAIDLGHHSDMLETAVRENIDAVLSDAAATLERLGVETAIADARTREDTERMRDALLSSVSHELRTPLASILGATTALAASPQVHAESRLAGLANVAREEAERLNDEIQNLLDATRINSEGLRPKFEWSELSDIVNAAVERKRARLASHRLDVRLAKDLPLLYVDSALIQQALGQILDNAAKYSLPGLPIRVEGLRSGHKVVVRVIDQGVGFSGQEIKQSWQHLFRGERHVATTPGLGLGLWIAKAFVDANAGTLEVTSRGEGQGATVSIGLPVPREQDDRMDSQDE